MKGIMSFIFEYLISPYEISDNPIMNYLLITIVGLCAFYIAFYLVGKIGARGELGSILHWTIRFVVFVILFTMVSFALRIITFITTVPIYYWIALLLIIVLIKIIIHSRKNKDSILNKKLFQKKSVDKN